MQSEKKNPIAAMRFLCYIFYSCNLYMLNNKEKGELKGHE